MSQEIITKIITAIVEGEPEQAVELTRQALAAGFRADDDHRSGPDSWHGYRW